ncbi:MAG: hypothetical protein CMP10_19175 [Zetaproteobacteria bacterium]|nr:hypothetical protein [Pseudobdellovibrionaceae bacterium]
MKLRKLIIASTIVLSQLALTAPVKKSILIVPGSLMPAAAYDSLVEKIEDSLGESLIVGKVSFLGNYPTKSTVVKTLKRLNEDIREEGFEPDITVLAHSQGGLASGGLPPSLAARTILLGSYNQDDWFKKATRTLIPTLTIGGMLDPLTSLERVLLDAYDSRLDPLSSFILLPDVNHFQFADGRIDGRDRVSPIETDEAHAKIVKYVTAFIQDRMTVVAAEEESIFSRQLISGYIKARESEENICEQAQFSHLGTQAPVDNLRVKLTTYDNQFRYPQFILDKSKVTTVAEGAIEIEVYQYSEKPASPIDIKYLKNINPRVIACKLRSAAAVARAMNTTYDSVSCLDLNLEILRNVASNIPSREKDRLAGVLDLEFRGDIQTGDDFEISTGLGFSVNDAKKDRGEQWALFSLFKLNNQDSTLDIKTASVITDLGDPDNNFLGAHYCKLIPPSRAYVNIINLK